MTDSLLQAYLPLFLWTGLGMLLLRFLPDAFPRFLGRSLYWVGVPLEILALARQTSITAQLGLAPGITVAALLGGLILAWSSLQIVKRLSASGEVGSAAISPVPASPVPTSPVPANPVPASPVSASPVFTSPMERSRQGSFVLSSMLGNTGFVGLAIAPAFVSPAYLSWLVFYSVTNNVIGTYGMGVFLASYFGRPAQNNHWWIQLRDVLTVPSLWAFVIGSSTHAIELPPAVESSLAASVWVVIPAALLLMGMRLSQLHGWKSLRLALVPTLLKSLLIPGLVGLITTTLGLTGDARLALVLMAGMPTAFAGLILAEEYELDRELIASSIVLTTAMLLINIPLWLILFGHGIPGF